MKLPVFYAVSREHVHVWNALVTAGATTVGMEAGEPLSKHGLSIYVLASGEDALDVLSKALDVLSEGSVRAGLKDVCVWHGHENRWLSEGERR